jgi:hypothetical protein
MYAVASAVGEYQIIQNQIVRRVAVLLVRIYHAVCRDTVPAAKLEILQRDVGESR